MCVLYIHVAGNRVTEGDFGCLGNRSLVLAVVAFLSQGLSLGTRAPCEVVGWLAHETQASLLPLFPSYGITTSMHRRTYFFHAFGGWPQVLMLSEQALHLLSPKLGACFGP